MCGLFRKRKIYSFPKDNETYDVRDNVGSECLNRPSHRAVIYRSELDFISRCILDYPNLETGGQLFGFWSNTGAPVVLFAIGPGRNARHNKTSFFQDLEYLKEVGGKLSAIFGLQHIGEWHSHHQLDLAVPSGGDVNSMEYGIKKPGFPRMLLCIGNCTPIETEINAFNFHVNNPIHYTHARWNVIEMESPYRPRIYSTLASLLIDPFTLKASHKRVESINAPDCSEMKIHWLTESVEHVEMMKTMVTMVAALYSDAVVNVLVGDQGEPIINIQSEERKIVFPYGFPTKSPILKIRDSVIEPCIAWDHKFPDIVQGFEHWLKTNFSPENNGNNENNNSIITDSNG